MCYIDKYNCLLSRKNGDCGRGDALWRTSLARIAYPDENWPALGMQLCNPEIGKFIRHPETDRDDCSRDQVIMAVIANYVTTGSILLVYYRLSKKFTMRDSWLWYQALKGNRIAGLLFKLWGTLAVWTYPDYARHLLAWQLYVMPGKHLILNWIGIRLADKNNFLLRLLHRRKLGEWDTAHYKPMNDFRWQRSLCKPSKGIVLFETPGEQYPIDKDVLKAIYEREINKDR